jgi:hypothetical protein
MGNYSQQKRFEIGVPFPISSTFPRERLGDIPLTDEACPVPPELVIEIISPEQSFSSLSEKAVDLPKSGSQSRLDRRSQGQADHDFLSRRTPSD